MAGGAAGPKNQSVAPASGAASSGTNWWDFLFNQITAPHSFGIPNEGQSGPSGPDQSQPQQSSTPAPAQTQQSAGTSTATIPGAGQFVGGFGINNQAEQQFVQKNYNYYIWTGQSQVINRAGRGQEGIGGHTLNNPTYAGDYIQQWQQASSAEIASLQTRLINATLLNPNGVAKGSWDPATENALAQAMAQSANHPNDPTFTVDAYINQRIDYNIKNGLLPSTGPKTYTVNSTNTHVALTDPEAAKGLLSNALEQYLGYQPNDAEVKQFTSMLNAQERKRPEVTKTKSVRVTDSSGQQHAYDSEKTSNSVTTGGYGGQAQYAVDYAKAQPGSAEYQAANLMEAFDQLLRGPAGPAG